MDQYTEYSRQGYFSRIGNSFAGAIFGLILFAGSFILLFWNEGKAVHTAEALSEGKASVMAVTPDTVNRNNEGKLIHFSGNAIGKPLTDDMFGVTEEAIHLDRVVEMRQWKETVKTDSQKDVVGGGQTTRKTYSYSEVWSRSLIDSSGFNQREHVNPTAMRVKGATWTASPVTVGGFTLPSELVSQIDNFTPLPLSGNLPEALPGDLQKDAQLSGGECYLSGVEGRPIHPDTPKIGDLKISLKVVKPGPVSVVGKQTGTTISAYPTKSGESLEILHLGTEPAAQMFAKEEQKNEIRTWILRAVGFLAQWLGLCLILNPLSTLFDIVGFIGSIVGFGIAMVGFLIAAILSSITVAVAWIFYRPLIGIAILGIAAAAIAYLISRWRQTAAARAGALVGAGPR